MQRTIVLIGINRPGKRKGFTPRTFEALGRANTRLHGDLALQAGLLLAHGAHSTANLDLPAMAPLMRRQVETVPLRCA